MLIIERFQSRGQQLSKFMRTKEIVYIRKESNSHRICLEHQHGRRFIVWNTNMAAVTSCENALSRQIMANEHSLGFCSKHNTIVRVIVLNQ